MDKFNEFFTNIADKIPFGKDFFKNSLPIFGIEINNLFLILVSLLLVIVAIILVVAVAVSSKKGKKAKTVTETSEGEAVAQNGTDSTACGALKDNRSRCAAAECGIVDSVKPTEIEAENLQGFGVKTVSEQNSDTAEKPQPESAVLSDFQESTEASDFGTRNAVPFGFENDFDDAEKLPNKERDTQALELSESDFAQGAAEARTPDSTQDNKDEDLSRLAAASISIAARQPKAAPQKTAAKAKPGAPASDGTKKPIKKAEPEQRAAQPAAAAEPAAKKSVNEAAKKGADNRYSGKFEVNLTVCGYRFFLIASNGQLLYESNGYTSADGALKGIETFKNAVPNGVFVVDEDKFNRFRYILNKRYAGENYTTKASCENSIESVKKFSQTAVIMPYVTDEAAEQAYAESLKERKAQKELDWAEIEKAEELVKPSGKFEITKGADGFHFSLIANNGQLLYASNGYASNKSANEGIKNFKKTVYSGTFFVDEDKFGRFRYILRGATFNSTYIGESYTAKAACEKIIQSVKRFVKSAVMPE